MSALGCEIRKTLMMKNWMILEPYIIMKIPLTIFLKMSLKERVSLNQIYGRLLRPTWTLRNPEQKISELNHKMSLEK